MEKNMRNICFVGRMGSGKTTLAEALVKEYKYQRFSLAQPVKLAACRIYNLMQEVTDTDHVPFKRISLDDIEEDKDKYRTLLQLTGTELGRDMFGNDVWIKQLLSKTRHCTHPVVVDDVRFRNELAALISEDFVPIFLTRSIKESRHSSEKLTRETFCSLMATTNKKENIDFFILDNREMSEYNSIMAIKRIAIQLDNS